MNELQVMCLMYVVIIILLIIIAVKELREIIYDIFKLIIIYPIKNIYQLTLSTFPKKNILTSNQLENPIENYTTNNLELQIINYPSYEEL